jgi:hypothetical protein
MRTTVEPFDDQYPPAERLPCTGRFEFVVSVNEAGRPSVQVRHDGRGIGDPLTDNSHVDDGYRVRDVFHLAYAAMLGWSPVTTKLMGRKRKSNPEADEAEDGGRAIVSEEDIALMAFAYATAITTWTAWRASTSCSSTSSRTSPLHTRSGPYRRRLGVSHPHWLHGVAALRDNNGGTVILDAASRSSPSRMQESEIARPRFGWLLVRAVASVRVDI